MKERLTKVKESELKSQAEKYEKMMEEQKKRALVDKEAMEKQYKKKIEELEADLKTARSGFDAER